VISRRGGRSQEGSNLRATPIEKEGGADRRSRIRVSSSIINRLVQSFEKEDDLERNRNLIEQTVAAMLAMLLESQWPNAETEAPAAATAKPVNLMSKLRERHLKSEAAAEKRGQRKPTGTEGES
jgi:non-homologous end joining protein Ku